MAQKKTWLLISFAGTTEALRAEKLFEQAGIGGALIPTPRSLSSSCGLCWRAALEQRPEVEAQIAAHRLHVEGLLEMDM